MRSSAAPPTPRRCFCQHTRRSPSTHTVRRCADQSAFPIVKTPNGQLCVVSEEGCEYEVVVVTDPTFPQSFPGGLVYGVRRCRGRGGAVRTAVSGLKHRPSNPLPMVRRLSAAPIERLAAPTPLPLLRST